jgi:hypothetical protein
VNLLAVEAIAGAEAIDLGLHATLLGHEPGDLCIPLGERALRDPEPRVGGDLVQNNGPGPTNGLLRSRRFGTPLAVELLALDQLVDHLRWSGFPWLVSAGAQRELDRVVASKGEGLRAGWRRLAEAQEEWGTDSYGLVAPAILSPESTARPNPLILRGLGVSSVEEIVAANGPLAEFRHHGDREIIRETLLSGARDPHDRPQIVLGKREVVLEHGLEVWRPSDALRAYIRRWNAQEEEFARRRAAASGQR